MEKWWKEHYIEGPVLLANQDNDMVLEEREIRQLLMEMKSHLCKSKL